MCLMNAGRRVLRRVLTKTCLSAWSRLTASNPVCRDASVPLAWWNTTLTASPPRNAPKLSTAISETHKLHQTSRVKPAKTEILWTTTSSLSQHEIRIYFNSFELIFLVLHYKIHWCTLFQIFFVTLKIIKEISCFTQKYIKWLWTLVSATG